MARTKQPSLLRAKIVKAASELFFEKGFSKTTSSELCSKVGMGTGNLTFYFPTKEHILAVLVQMMIDYQWKEMENAADEGKSSLLAYCLELSTLVAIADEFPEMNDFFAAASHYEFDQRRQKKLREGKIDITYIHYLPNLSANSIGNYLRQKISWYKEKIKQGKYTFTKKGEYYEFLAKV